jgi:hypothetical protein
MSLASRSPNVDHLAQRLYPAASALGPEAAQTLARDLAAVVAELDNKLRVEVDEALGRLEARIDEELRD